MRNVLCEPALAWWNADELQTIASRIARLDEIERMEEDGSFDVLPKKEVIGLRKKETA